MSARFPAGRRARSFRRSSSSKTDPLRRTLFLFGATPRPPQIKTRQSGFDLEKEEGTCGSAVFAAGRKRNGASFFRRCGWDGGTRTHYIGVKVRCVTITLHPNVRYKPRPARPASARFQWGGIWGSNPRHPEPQSGALPTELIPPNNGLLSCILMLQNQSPAKRV